MAVGIVMCLLAAIFAVEAKLGWYSPDSAARVEFSATKLRADDPPKMITEAVASPAPVPDLLPQFIFVVALALIAASATLGPECSAPRAQMDSSPGVFPPLFLRPPPHA